MKRDFTWMNSRSVAYQATMSFRRLIRQSARVASRLRSTGRSRGSAGVLVQLVLEGGHVSQLATRKGDLSAVGVVWGGGLRRLFLLRPREQSRAHPSTQPYQIVFVAAGRDGQSHGMQVAAVIAEQGEHSPDPR